LVVFQNTAINLVKQTMAKRQAVFFFFLFSIFWLLFLFLHEATNGGLGFETGYPFHFRGSNWNPNHPQTTKPSNSRLSHEGWIFTKRS